MKPFSTYQINKSLVDNSDCHEVAISIVESGRIEGNQLISSTCINDEEIDREVDNLIQNLEDIRRSAKKIIMSNKSQ